MSQTPNPVHEQQDVTVLCNQAVHTDREVRANRADIIIKNKKKQKTCTLIDVAILADRNTSEKGSGKEVKMREFSCRDTANMEPEMYDCTSYNRSYWNSNEKLKEKLRKNL
jgi:predicted nucleic acid-binding Zn ribbon protein